MIKDCIIVLIFISVSLFCVVKKLYFCLLAIKNSIKPYLQTQTLRQHSKITLKSSRSLTDRIEVSGTSDVGSIPTEGTKLYNSTATLNPRPQSPKITTYILSAWRTQTFFDSVLNCASLCPFVEESKHHSIKDTPVSATNDSPVVIFRQY